MKLELQDESKITLPQLNYIELLTQDLLFSRHQRNRHMSELLNKEVAFLDELSKKDATKVISYFKLLKDHAMMK
jgi:hypothetical protein